ncbi:MAG: carbamoyltransferase HypF [Pseudomonadota bacterium]|nr:carbamoyltransferase HypF [Pseudomonadota bacterium]
MTEARRIRVRGQVQGVGFRPFIWQLAQHFDITGQVLNDPEGVLIFAQGAALDAFTAAIRTDAPPLARVDAVESAPCEALGTESFDIVASTGAGAETRVTPDAATCADCLSEIRDSSDRRFGYAFANCTHCGPRFTILRALPYDRGQTTMAPFDMCDACRAEYENPADRRFHAQPVACSDCGPRVWVEPESDGDPIADAADRLLNGQVLAIKGLGGFHLACDATNAEAITTLRERKRRPAKPFALMGTLEMIRRYASVGPADEALLADAAAPVVLLDAKGEALPDGIAPDQITLGWMLPYTPLHHLLLTAVNRPLVMTSGNLSGEPQVIGNQEARDKLGAFADAFVMHDRDIARRLDDSVERADPPMILRRARGRVPGTLPLPEGFDDAPQVAAYGGQMKSAICLIKNGQALLGHHLGELDEALTYDAFLQADADYADLFDHKPDLVACDLHPDFRASVHARGKGLPVVEVQHHHAHLASCLAENGWPLDGGKVAGIILDGTGLGADGTVWGGEVLLGDYHGFERHAWLKPAPLIGGDMASREPWRNALARLDQAGLSDWADALFGDRPLAMARMAMDKGLNAPMCSSAGRLFDAVAACLGICPERQSYEGEAAMRLEALAQKATPDEMAFYYDITAIGPNIDPSEMWGSIRYDLSNGVSSEIIALRFHSALGRAFAQAAGELVADKQAKAIVLSGGCFQNALLHRLTCEWLTAMKIDVPVLVHKSTPANDGGLALGQAVIAAARHLTNR